MYKRQILYCIPVIVVLMLEYFLEILYSMKVREENISSLTSFTSTIMRCFSVATLLAARVIIRGFSRKRLFLVIPTVSITAAALLLKKKFSEPVSGCVSSDKAQAL